MLELRGRRALVIIPAYNEQGALGNVIDRVRFHLPTSDIVVIDDGSRDSTADVARGKGVQVIRLPFNCGIGTAMQTGYIYAFRNGYDVAIQIDGDGQHDPSEVRHLLAPIFDGSADLVIGSRFLSHDGYKSSATRRIGIAWLASVISLLVHQRITDPTSGYRAATRAAISAFAEDYPTDYPEPEVIVTLKRSGRRVSEVPVVMSDRKHGRSSITALRSVYYMVKVTLAILVGLFRASRWRKIDGS